MPTPTPYSPSPFSENAVQSALADLTTKATTRHACLMCAEALPWRCHRRLIADALIVRGWTVLDIFGPGRAKEHEMTEFARVVEGEVIYPGTVSG